MLSWSQTHLLQLIQSVMYWTKLDYIYFQGTGISIITFLNNGQMLLAHFSECYLKVTTRSSNAALLATTTQSEHFQVSMQEITYKLGIKKFFFPFSFSYSRAFLRINLMYRVLRALQKVP